MIQSLKLGYSLELEIIILQYSFLLTLDYQNTTWRSQPIFKTIEQNFLLQNGGEKHSPEPRSERHRRKSGIHTETMTREVPAVLQTGTQNRHRTATERRRYNKYRVDRKRTINSRRFPVGVGPEALYQITRAEYKSKPDSIKVKDLIRLFTEFYMPKRNTYHSRGDFFWAKQTEEETPEEFWRQLIEIEKGCNFNTISAEELLISKYMTKITDKKLRDKITGENTGTEESNQIDQTEHI